MGAVALLFRSLVRRRWRSFVAVALLIGLGGSVALAAGAGARRTLSAYPRYLRAGQVSDLAVDYPVKDFATDFASGIAHLPQVVAGSSATYIGMNVATATPTGDPDPSLQFESVGSLDGRFIAQDRAVVIHGRLPRAARADEVLINQALADAGLRLGQTIPLATVPHDNDEDGTSGFETGVVLDRARVRVVGIGLLPEEVVQDDIDRGPRMLFTPAFTRAHLESANYPWQGLRVRGGGAGVPAAKRAIVSSAPKADQVLFREQAPITAKVQRSERPIATALGIFAAAVAFAMLVLAGQAFSRLLSFERDDERGLRAMGLGPAARGLPMALVALGTVVVGAVLAILGALALSPLAPVGIIRRVDPDPGAALDVTAVIGGAAVLTVLLTVLIGFLVVRAVGRASDPDARSEPSRLAAAAAGLGPAAAIGTRMALEPGRGRTAVPVRTNLFAVTGAVVVVVAASTFGANLHRLVGHPALYGAPWSGVIAADGGYGEVSMPAMGRAMRDDEAVDGWAGATFAAVGVDGHDTPVMGLTRGRGSVGPPVLRGRLPADDREILLAGGTAKALHVDIGDKVALTAGGPSKPFTVVGTGVLPAIGKLFSEHTSPGIGALVSGRTVQELSPDQPLAAAVLVRLRPGLAKERELRRLATTLPRAPHTNAYDVLIDQRPADIANSSSVGAGPTALAGVLGAAAVLSVALTAAVSARRRRADLAVLKAIGFTRRQLATAVRWQAGLTMTIALVVGTVLGIVVGRAVWRAFANQLHVVPATTIPVLLLAAVAVALLAASVLAAAPIGRSAARTPTAVTLRTE
ncbi:MAG: putative transport system permease protein [Actinomycetota bacterium]|jgi:hypothetical protein